MGESSRLAEDQLLANARQWLLARLVVIRQATCHGDPLYGQILDILRSRSLQPATVDKVLYGAAGRLRAPAEADVPSAGRSWAVSVLPG